MLLYAKEAGGLVVVFAYLLSSVEGACGYASLSLSINI